MHISTHRNMIVAESFLRSFEIYGKHTVYSYGVTFYSEARISLGLEHRLYSI